MFNTTQRLSWLSSLVTAAFLGLMTLLSGCGGGGASAGDSATENIPLAVDPSANVVAYNGNPITLFITGGTKPYIVTSSDTSAINVTNNVPGSTVVFDAYNVAVDTPVTLTVRDNKGVMVSSAVTVRPSVINNTLIVTPDPATPGVGCGTAVCSGMMASVSVQLKNMATPLVNRNVRFAVIQGDYRFSTNASATTFADTIDLTTDQNGYAIARIKANTSAPTQYAILKVTDLDGGSVLQTTFTIAQYTDGAGTLSVVPDKQTITAYYKDECTFGVRADYIIHGGTPPYQVRSSTTGVATVSPATVSTNGGGFTATTQGSVCGEATFDITDATGRVITASLDNVLGTNEVPPTVVFYTTAPSAVTLASTTGTASFKVGGGAAPYYASSSNTGVATVSTVASNGSFTVTGVAAGTAVITLADSAGATKTFTVTVP